MSLCDQSNFTSLTHCRQRRGSLKDQRRRGSIHTDHGRECCMLAKVLFLLTIDRVGAIPSRFWIIFYLPCSVNMQSCLRDGSATTFRR